MAVQVIEIDKTLLIKIRFIAFMVMKGGESFLTFLKHLIRKNHQFLEADFLYW